MVAHTAGGGCGVLCPATLDAMMLASRERQRLAVINADRDVHKRQWRGAAPQGVPGGGGGRGIVPGHT